MSHLAYDIQTCIRFVTYHTPLDDGTAIKPELLHAIRTGMKLYSYQDLLSREVILAGFMHDLHEESITIGEHIRKQYGAYIYSLVQANSKDKSITHRYEKLIDINQRCAAIGFNALIIKVADVYDNILYVNDMRLDHNTQIARAVFIGKDLMQYETLFNKHPLYLELKKLIIKYDK